MRAAAQTAVAATHLLPPVTTTLLPVIGGIYRPGSSDLEVVNCLGDQKRGELMLTGEIL